MTVFDGQAHGLDVPELDITDRFQTLEKLNELQPDVIVNCAAYTAVDACETDPLCWKVNADGPRYLAEWVAANGAFLVHVSTDYVFSGDRKLYEASVESDAVGPVSEYGRSKLAGEQAVLESGADAAILRTAWLYGATGKNFLKTMLRLALQNPEREIRVVNDQFGSPTWSHTLARQIAAVVKSRQSGVFHATSEEYCSWYELAKGFLERMEVPFRMASCSTDEYPTPARRPENSILENEALKTAGLNLFNTWQVELDEFVRNYRDDLICEAKELIQ
jgi:dTDP-4-dehydrorhamnose reductase